MVGQESWLACSSVFHCYNFLPAEDLEAFAPTDTEKGWPKYMRINCVLVSMSILNTGTFSGFSVGFYINEEKVICY